MEAEEGRELLLKVSAHVVPQGVAVQFIHLLGFWYCFGGAAGKLTEEIPCHSFNFLKTSFLFVVRRLTLRKLIIHERSSHSGCSKNSERSWLRSDPKDNIFYISYQHGWPWSRTKYAFIHHHEVQFYLCLSVLFVCIEFHSTRFKAGSLFGFNWTHSHLCSHFVRAVFLFYLNNFYKTVSVALILVYSYRGREWLPFWNLWKMP